MVGRSVRRSCPRDVDRTSKVDVVVGGYYQISHDNLPSEAPFWLKFIKAVMVSDRNRLKLTVRFPSLKSFQTAEQTCSCPVMDMWFSMGEEVARRVLWRHVPSPDFDDFDDFKEYWLLDSSALAPKLEHEEVSPKYLISSAYESEEENLDEVVSTETQLVEVKEVEEVKEVVEVKEEMQLVEVKEEIADQDFIGKGIPKKKRRTYWSDKSLEAGKKVIFSILKEKKVTADNPILRPALRQEARKQIGDTGLLDHLLKDLTGKIAPDGVSRFQRCFSVRGVTVYWLESADMIHTRQKAGVADPLWTPPPGWKMGACTSGCPCSKELELLKEDAERIKRELEETKKQLNEIRAVENTRYVDYTNWVGGYW